MMTCFLAWYYNNNGLAIRIALQSKFRVLF
jgi:hypothetical protein